MVRALLDGTKTQTRRVVKHIVTPIDELRDEDEDGPTEYFVDSSGQFRTPARYGSFAVPCPYGQPGDRLWVRETWRGIVSINPPNEPPEWAVARYVPDAEYCHRVEFQATQRVDKEPYRPSIHMPRWASRLLLEITAVRCERLQDISEPDALAEGVNVVNIGKSKGVEYENYLDDDCFEYFAKDSYATLWEKINGLGSFAANPWVWVVDFKVFDGKEAASAAE